jgi:hypothetical protein
MPLDWIEKIRDGVGWADGWISSVMEKRWVGLGWFMGLQAEIMVHLETRAGRIGVTINLPHGRFSWKKNLYFR